MSKYVLKFKDLNHDYHTCYNILKKYYTLSRVVGLCNLFSLCTNTPTLRSEIRIDTC